MHCDAMFIQNCITNVMSGNHLKLRFSLIPQVVAKPTLDQLAPSQSVPNARGGVLSHSASEIKLFCFTLTVVICSD